MEDRRTRIGPVNWRDSDKRVSVVVIFLDVLVTLLVAIT